MNKLQRIKKVVKFAIAVGLGQNQAEIGKLLGYNNGSAFSHVLNGIDKEPNNFVGKLKDLIPNLNVNWVETGEGEMLTGTSNIIGNNHNIGSNNINDTDSIKEIIKLLTDKHEKEINAKNEQIDRLISLLEKK